MLQSWPILPPINIPGIHIHTYVILSGSIYRVKVTINVKVHLGYKHILPDSLTSMRDPSVSMSSSFKKFASNSTKNHHKNHQTIINFNAASGYLIYIKELYLNGSVPTIVLYL